MESNHDFVFSIVMAVYNSAPYLREAFQSILNQSIGFDTIQLILVDDGSKDESGKICDSLAKGYPRNVISLHKKNGGPSSARNLGLEYATGRYINYMDSDDRLTSSTLEGVAAFFAEHEHETDVVSIPICYFEAEAGEHWQNALYQKGNRVLDLRKDFGFLQASASNAFFIREKIRDVRFQEELSYAEDTRYAMTCLARLQKIGLMKDGCYDYRRRKTGNSMTQTIGKNPLWKTQWMEQY